GFSHTFPSDTEFLLVAPDGSTTVLMSQVGGGAPGVVGVDLTFDDAGPAVPSLPATGTYRPSQSALVGDFLTGGAPGPDPPTAPYGTNLFVHNGADPNGDWKLYAQDAFTFDFGEVAGGWELVLTTVPPVEISIDDVSVAEGGDAVFTVSLSTPSVTEVSVAYQTASGSAQSGADFTPASGTIVFEPLAVSKTVQVTTRSDGLGEADEDFSLDLSNPVGATIADAQGVGTITDADPNASIGDVQKAEGNAGRTSFLFVVTLDTPPAAPVSLRYATESLGATPGRDYIHVSGVLSFAAGQTSRSLSVPVVGDRVEERDEFFKVVLSSPTGGLAIDTAEALGWIVNDDFVGPPKVSISDASLGEGNAGSANMTFTVRLSRVSNSVLTVPYRTANGTAIAGSDYTAASGQLSFPPGVTERTVSVPITGDLDPEGDETFFVNLGAARGVAFLDRQGKGTIVDDE
ncbi:MAG TPA: Calx-beta domain-containing protein, partial [Vicinamibacteria bacterium]